MKGQLERYFELFPILAIILIMMAAERQQSKLQYLDLGFGLCVPSIEVPAPRLIFR